MATKLKSGETILFIGDSITDCGRRDQFAPLGCGYVKMVRDLMLSREPEKQVTILNKGISGNVVTELQARWTDDVMVHRPDWLSIKIGINDLHRTLVANNPNAVPPEMFERAYDEVLTRTRAGLPECHVLLIDPFYISREDSPNSPRKRVLDLIPDYIGIIHRMAKRYGTRLVRTHEIFQKQLEHHDADTFCPEPVHPNPTGHLVIAEAVYDALCR